MQGRSRIDNGGGTVRVLTWIKDALDRLMRMNILDCTRAASETCV